MLKERDPEVYESGYGPILSDRAVRTIVIGTVVAIVLIGILGLIGYGMYLQPEMAPNILGGAASAALIASIFTMGTWAAYLE
jgi:hypothetical protein